MISQRWCGAAWALLAVADCFGPRWARVAALVPMLASALIAGPASAANGKLSIWDAYLGPFDKLPWNLGTTVTDAILV
ncbi:MAG: hypothetical protein FJ100_20470 [Deltaproteobacteria bacterium]|nr:hypothetical protein [Deltaproteobacteria bacterium]